MMQTMHKHSANKLAPTSSQMNANLHILYISAYSRLFRYYVEYTQGYEKIQFSR